MLHLYQFVLNTDSCVISLQIERIKIGHDGAGPGAGWFLDEVRVDVPSKGMYYLFACHRWLAEDEGDGLIEIELDPTDVTQGKASKGFLKIQ